MLELDRSTHARVCFTDFFFFFPHLKLYNQLHVRVFFLFLWERRSFPSIEWWRMQSSPVASIKTKTAHPSLPSRPPIRPHHPRPVLHLQPLQRASSSSSHLPTSACGFSRSSLHSRGAVTPPRWPPPSFLHCHLHRLLHRRLLLLLLRLLLPHRHFH